MIVVDETLCVGCGTCEPNCPSEALKAWGYLEINTQKCSNCFGGMYHIEDAPLNAEGVLAGLTQKPGTRLCIENCPVGALSIKED